MKQMKCRLNIDPRRSFAGADRPIPASPLRDLYFLAGRMTDFYRDCVILGDGTSIALRDSRLRLCSATASVLKQGMGLLGITALDRI
jgi:arginyl-tRNA synthetase